jgi:L-arabinokinase
MGCVRASAPGRLDLLGGVADYAGALVLEIPTSQATEVEVTSDAAFVVGPAVVPADDLARLAQRPYREMRNALAPFPVWTHYVLGVVMVLVRHRVVEPAPVRVQISSDLPVSVGVASSAALEVAMARALAPDLDPLRLAALCQEAENQVVGAPCGIMDQVAVAVGRPGALLPILCRPATVRPSLPLPPDLEVVGWPTGASHDVSGQPYRRARAAAFMGKRMVEDEAGRSWSWVSELPTELVDALPDTLSGAAFLDRWDGAVDDLTSVDEAECYPVRAATAFGRDEHGRSERALAVLAADAAALGPLLAASDAAYTSMGLGHPAASAVVTEAQQRPGVLGARSSGGGSGGTVVVACRAGSLDDVEGLIR